jgi:hypothetical protein
MSRKANWTEVRARLEAHDKYETFEVVRRFAQDYFANSGQVPVIVEVWLDTETAYDDEGGSFICFSIHGCTVKDLCGRALEAFDPEDGSLLERDTFDGYDLQERLMGSEAALFRHFHVAGDRCVVDLHDPPPRPRPFLVQDSDEFAIQEESP